MVTAIRVENCCVVEVTVLNEYIAQAMTIPLSQAIEKYAHTSQGFKEKQEWGPVRRTLAGGSMDRRAEKASEGQRRIS